MPINPLPHLPCAGSVLPLTGIVANLQLLNYRERISYAEGKGNFWHTLIQITPTPIGAYLIYLTQPVVILDWGAFLVLYIKEKHKILSCIIWSPLFLIV